ncbi:MAG: hypothetical protein ACYTX0_42740 [Nostoc sp.]
MTNISVDFMIFHFRLIRRTVYEQVRGIDPNFTYAEEYDLCLKLSEVTDFYHIAQPLYYYRRHSGNLTNEQFEPIRWSQKAINNALLRRGLDRQSRSLISERTVQPALRLGSVTTAGVTLSPSTELRVTPAPYHFVEASYAQRLQELGIALF